MSPHTQAMTRQMLAKGATKYQIKVQRSNAS